MLPVHTASSARHSESEQWVAIIDDDKSIRRSLARAFDAYGIPARVFASAEEFLEECVAPWPCGIVLDVQLRGLSGFDLQDLLIERFAAPPPIVFISAHADLLAQRARTERAHGCLQKPFDIEALLALIEPLLQPNERRGPHEMRA